MPLANRDKDTTEQINVFEMVLNSTPSGVSAGIVNPGLSTGTTFPFFTAPYPCQVVSGMESAWGLSGTPVHSIYLYRLAAGGFTQMVMGTTFAPPAFGTSGSIGISMVGGASWVLQTGDQLVLYAQGSNSAVAVATVGVAVKALQDFKSHFGYVP